MTHVNYSFKELFTLLCYLSMNIIGSITNLCIRKYTTIYLFVKVKIA